LQAAPAADGALNWTGLDIALAPAQERSFSDALLNDVGGILLALAKIDARNAQAYNLKDKQLIEQVVAASPGGFEHVNACIHESLQSWVVRCGSAALQAAKERDAACQTPRLETLQLYRSLSRVLANHGHESQRRTLSAEAAQACLVLERSLEQRVPRLFFFWAASPWAKSRELSASELELLAIWQLRAAFLAAQPHELYAAVRLYRCILRVRTRSTNFGALHETTVHSAGALAGVLQTMRHRKSIIAAFEVAFYPFGGGWIARNILRPANDTLLVRCFNTYDTMRGERRWQDNVLIIGCELLFFPIFLILALSMVMTEGVWKREIDHLCQMDTNARLQSDLAALVKKGPSALTDEEQRAAELARGHRREAAAFSVRRNCQLAEDAYRKALPALIRILGAEHPEALGCALALARLLSSQGRRSTILANYGLTNVHAFPLLFDRAARSKKFAKAEVQLRETLLVCRNKLGRLHPTTIEFVHELALCLQRQAMQSDRFGQTIEAMSLAHGAVETLSITLGPEHERTQYARGFVKCLELLHVRESVTAAFGLRMSAIVLCVIAGAALFITSIYKSVTGVHDPLLTGIIDTKQPACAVEW
jgi:hypothetical protein